MAKGDFNGTLYVRCDPRITAWLLRMQGEHRISPTEMTRGLLEAACDFYEEHGWFSFPVVVQPEAFQGRYVAEEQAAFGMPTPGELAHVETDRERKVTFADRAFEALCGYSLEELRGKNLGALLQGVETERREVARIRKALEGRKPITATLTNYRKDGGSYRARMKITPTEKGFAAEVRRID